MTSRAFVDQIRRAFEAHRDAERAAGMARYLKDQFPFLGLPRPVYQALAKPIVSRLGKEPAERFLLDAAHRLWKLPEREFQHCAGDLLDRFHRRLSAAALGDCEHLLVTKPWWDSVDLITTRVVAPLVTQYPELRRDMDRWSRADNFWLRRAAIIHQLGYKRRTDTKRLFAYCSRNARDPEFFIRKAIGWALRQHARTDPDAIRAYVEAHPELSPLSRREALKHL